MVTGISIEGGRSGPLDTEQFRFVVVIEGVKVKGSGMGRSGPLGLV